MSPLRNENSWLAYPFVLFREGAPGSGFEPGSWFAPRLWLRETVPVGLRRIYGLGHLHFVTFSCYRRLPLLKSKHARDLFVRELGKVRRELEFQLIGYVVMPEHVHLLISEPKKGTPSTVLHKLKLEVARKLRKRGTPVPSGQMSLPFGKSEVPLRAFWQARFHDFNVYSDKKNIEKLKYMHANPLKRGLVSHPKDWPWSSWAFYFGAAVSDPDGCRTLRQGRIQTKTQVHNPNLGHPATPEQLTKKSRDNQP